MSDATLGIVLQGALALMAIVAIGLVISIRSSSFRHYKRQPYLFTPAERNFYKQLVQAVGNEFIVFGKVRVADLVTITADYGNKGSMRSLGKIAQKHVDYCLCRPHDFSIVCVIELNDKSHNQHDRQSRDVFMEKLFRKVKLPLVWVEAKNTYRPDQIRDQIFASIAQYEKNQPSLHFYNPREFRSS